MADFISIKMPSQAQNIISRLENAGFEAFVVGGCVRDSLLGRAPLDWDITTNALPEQIGAVFRDCRILEIGSRHGTVSVKIGQKYFEITTYRIDGDYSDNRRPDSVRFTAQLREDLLRRDFTINAMAYNNSGLVDYFGGLEDLRNGVVRCVGSATQRFAEDYLRIMRAYRFGAVLDFEPDPDVREAARAGRKNLLNIAAERIQTELAKLLLSDNFDKTKMFFEDCGDVLFPEVACLKGFDHNNKYHHLDVYDHTFEVLRHTPRDLAMRAAALLHDTGKYHTKTVDAQGIFHFHNHAKISFEIAKKALKRLCFDNATTERALAIIRHHADKITPERAAVKRLMYRLGTRAAFDVLNFEIADSLAKSRLAKETKLVEVRAALQLAHEIIESGEPTQIKDLAINGQDVMQALGIAPSPGVGKCLAALLEKVIDNPEINNRKDLLDEISTL